MCRLPGVACLLAVALTLTVAYPAAARAHGYGRAWEEAGSLVAVAVEVEGRGAPLYPAPDGSGRFYLQAWPQARYAIRLANNSPERLGVVVTVDGLNAISGQREPSGPGWGSAPPGRMYVLGPWDSMQVRGWRTSLDQVRRFTFVDEERSYATRTGKANAKMGWIEVAVYRERRPRHGGVIPLEGPDRDQARDRAEQPEAAAPSAEGRPEAEGALERQPPASPRSYPGTGWGAPAHDPAMVVEFDPQPHPAERVTLRYEYASGLRALGIDVRPWAWARDRLRERDRGEDGFARPPR